MGGDHSIAYANIRATYQARGEPAGGLPVVHFDAHLDTVDTVWSSGFISCRQAQNPVCRAECIIFSANVAVNFVRSGS